MDRIDRPHHIVESDQQSPPNVDLRDDATRLDPDEPLPILLRDLHTGQDGLSAREAARRLERHGPNLVVRRGRSSWPRDLIRQLTHPLALLLWLAAILAAANGTVPLAAAIAGVIVLNAVLAFAQERQAERAVEALATFLPDRATVRRDGQAAMIPAAELVPGDILILAAGDRVSADSRIIDGAVEVDMSALTGESVPSPRSTGDGASTGPLVFRHDLVFSGTACTSGDASALFATGMATELGRIAALSQRVGREDSPLERQVKRVAWLIAAVVVGVGIAFLPIGTLAAHLPLPDAATFAVGLLVANVPEGLLPTITLALAVGVRSLAAGGALVKRLSAVETLGSTSMICTDKTGTLTLNLMRVTSIWTPDVIIDSDRPVRDRPVGDVACRLAVTITACNDADILAEGQIGDPTEIALLRAAADLGIDTSLSRRQRRRARRFPFDPTLRRMATVDRDRRGFFIHAKGAPEDILTRCTRTATADATDR